MSTFGEGRVTFEEGFKGYRDEDESKMINPVLNHTQFQRGAVKIPPSHYNNPTTDK